MRHSPILRVTYTTTSDLDTPGTVDARKSRPKTRRSWKAANMARRRSGRRLAMKMLILGLSHYRASAIAEMFGSTRGAVSQRLYRLRRGQYALRSTGAT
jgi:hypothetical protein